MLANFFGKSSPINFVIISALFFVFFGLHIYSMPIEIITSKIVSLTLISLVVFFFYNFILFKNKLTLYNSYGFYAFIILMATFPIAYVDQNALLLHGLLLIYYRRILSLRNSSKVLSKLFDSGFWLGIMFIVNPVFSAFGLLIYFSNSLFQKTNWQTLLVPAVGFTSPLVCAFSYYFWIDQELVFWSLFDWYISFDFSLYQSLTFQIPLILIGVISLFAIIISTKRVIQVSGNYRKYRIMVLMMLISSLVFIALLPLRNGSELQFLFFPISIIIANGIESVRSGFWKEVILFLILIFPVFTLII